MAAIRFKQFSQPAVLREIGRELLRKFLEPFRVQLQASRVDLPHEQSRDTEYYKGWAQALKFPEQVPDELRGAIFAIEDLASAKGQERLEAGLQHAGLQFDPEWKHCPEHVGVHLWLFAPAVLLREHRNQQKRSLRSHECFAPKKSARSRAPIVVPNQETLAALTKKLDTWFALHQRGWQNTRIDLQPLGSGLAFLVRHADLLTWTHRIDGEDTDSIQLRRKRTDSIIYSVEHDELRVSAQTTGEAELYRQEFGLALRSNPNYFARENRYTLEPLRWEREDALDPHGTPGIRRIVLTKIEIEWGSPQHEVTASRADDIFHSPGKTVCETCATPTGGHLSRAEFLITFADADTPRTVQILPPNTLRLQRAADGDAVTRWLSKSWLLLAGQTSGETAEAI